MYGRVGVWVNGVGCALRFIAAMAHDTGVPSVFTGANLCLLIESQGKATETEILSTEIRSIFTT